MAKAKINTPNGTEIIIEGDPSEVAKIIAQIQGSPAIAAHRSTPKAEKQKSEKKQQTATDRVILLKEDGFFDQPRALGDVRTELQKSGYLYPVTTLSGIMLSLVQKKQLTRAKIAKGWAYGKR